MFSSKFKSWVESHLTRSGKKFKSNSKKNRNRDDRLAAPSPHHFGAPSSTMSSTASSATATASVNNNIVIFHDNDRVTSLPVLNANGRSNAALVIQLQNDIAMNASWNKHNSQLVHSPLISWKRDHHQPSFRNQVMRDIVAEQRNTNNAFSFVFVQQKSVVVTFARPFYFSYSSSL